MFHACVQRFDGMDEKILDGKLNKSLTKGETMSHGCAIQQFTHRLHTHWLCIYYILLRTYEATSFKRQQRRIALE